MGKLRARFLTFVRKSSACWEWGGVILNNGYGQISVRQKRWLAHRLSWHIFRGVIPKDKLVLHKCDNPSCVKPTHLFIGTHLDNSMDMVKKGRTNGPRGERQGRSKLTNEIVKMIRSDERTQAQIANSFRISCGHVSEIKSGKVWGHI